MAGRILNFEKVVAETVTVAVNGGPTWELRDDIPAGVMALAFRVFDLEQSYAQATQETGAGEAAGLDEQRKLLDELEAATLEAVTVIVRHSYPEVTRAEVAEALAPSARTAVLRVFFPLLLRRFGKLSGSLPEDAPQTTPTAPALNRAQRRARAAGTGATRSRRS